MAVFAAGAELVPFSPLADEAVKQQLKGARANNLRKYPGNIRRWINVSAEDADQDDVESDSDAEADPDDETATANEDADAEAEGTDDDGATTSITRARKRE